MVIMTILVLLIITKYNIMETYYFYKETVNKLFFEVELETQNVTAFTMHCDPALVGTVTEANHKGIWVKLPQICDAEMTVFLSSAKYQRIRCTRKEAFKFQDERREKKIKEILSDYENQK